MDSAENVIAVLESFRQRKGMYVQPLSVEKAHSFLSGFYIACMACGLVADWSAWKDAAQARGWNTGAASPVPTMRAAGMDEEAIIDELICICQEAVVRCRNTE